MPIYEYLCDDCGTRYERIVMSKTQKIACPKCHSGRKTQQLSVFSTTGKSDASGGPPGGCSFGGGGGCTPGGCGCH